MGARASDTRVGRELPDRPSEGAQTAKVVIFKFASHVCVLVVFLRDYTFGTGVF